MSENLIFLAGEKALSLIRSEGLSPERIKIVAGAAGGPKWLVLNHLDRVLFSSWFKDRTAPLFLIGSSIGAWRFSAVSQKQSLKAAEKFQSAYLNQCYGPVPTPEDVVAEMTKRMDEFLDDAGIREILNHPCLRLNIMAVRCKGLTSRDKKFPLSVGLLGAILLNLLHRPFMKFFFERALFYDPRDIPPFFDMSGFPVRKIPLTPYNIKAALLASGSIPMVMSGVRDIPGAPEGTYRDGGVTDYHLDIPFMKKEEDGIVLFPHYSRRVVPGWLDKKLFWRKPSASNMENVLLVAPSQEFINRLPGRRIPDRNDFRTFQGRDRERIAYWNTVIDMSKYLAEEFTDAAESGKIRERLKPICTKTYISGHRRV